MSTTQRINEESQRDPDTLEREAEATRRDIAHTMDLLEQRLSPGQLLDRALSMGREQGGEFATNLGRQIKYHPIPLLLTAVGISWLAMAENRPQSSGAGGTSAGGLAESARHMGEAAREKAGSISGSLSDSAHSASERMHQTADSLRASASGAAESMRQQGERVRERFQQTLHEQPLVLGALGLALGAILGGAMPRTRYEDRTIGEYGDRVREQAAGTAEAAERAGARTAEAARDAATQTAREETSRH